MVAIIIINKKITIMTMMIFITIIMIIVMITMMIIVIIMRTYPTVVRVMRPHQKESRKDHEPAGLSLDDLD